MRWDNSIQPQGRVFKDLPIALNVLRQFDAEIVEGKFIERNALAEILKIQQFVLQPQQLLVAVGKVLCDQLPNLFRLQ